MILGVTEACRLVTSERFPLEGCHAVQRPISLACITVKVERPLWKDRPSWFLVA